MAVTVGHRQVLVSGGPQLTPAAAQEAGTADRLRAVLTAAADTPDGASLVATALADAWTALGEARQAVAAADLATLQRHAQGVLHAVDPTRVTRGPASGYGVRRAVAEIQQQVEQIAAADRAPDATTLAPRAVAAATNVLAWTGALVAVAERISTATSLTDARRDVDELHRLARRLTFGLEREEGTRIHVAPGGTGLLVMRTALVALQGQREPLRAATPEAAR